MCMFLFRDFELLDASIISFLQASSRTVTENLHDTDCVIRLKLLAICQFDAFSIIAHVNTYNVVLGNA